MTGRPACCARAASGHAAAVPPSAAMNFRLAMLTAIGPSNPAGEMPDRAPHQARSAIRRLESRSLQWAARVLSAYLRAHYRCEREGIHKRRPGAHAELVAAPSGHSPRPIPIDADAIDLEDRADQLNKVLNALSAYLTAVLDDTAQNVPGGLDLRKADSLLFDLASNVSGTLQHAVERMAWRVA
jgi:hypothetical protein